MNLLNLPCTSPCPPHAENIRRLRTLNAELLAALQDITELCEVYTGHPIHNDQRVKQARAAIAKATQ